MTDTGFTLWFTGLSGSGKTTITNQLVKALHKRDVSLEVLDGDIVRENLSKGLGFSKEDRDTNIRRIAFVANLLSRNGVPVITAAISPYKEIRNEAREMMDDRFIEVYVKASVETCEERDVWDYLARHDIPYNSLHDRGYASIGCTHCTKPGDGRDGRWAGHDKTDCGMHA